MTSLAMVEFRAKGPDPQRWVGQRYRQVGRVDQGEDPPLVLDGQRFGQDGGNDIARASRAFRLHQPLDPRENPIAELGWSFSFHSISLTRLSALVSIAAGCVDQPQGSGRSSQPYAVAVHHPPSLPGAFAG
jgi:hypothetical protein